MRQSIDTEFFHSELEAGRGAAYDGQWWIGCKSTGIYCRPVCSAKLPPAAGIDVFASPAQAEAAGYRPCLSCHPESAPHLPVEGDDRATAAAALIDEHLASAKCLSTVEGVLGLERAQLDELLLGHYGANAEAYLATARRLLAKALLTTSKASPGEVAMACGYSGEVELAHEFASHYGFSLQRFAVKRKPDPWAVIPQAFPQLIGWEPLVVNIGYRTPYRFDLILSFLEFRAIKGAEVVQRLGRSTKRFYARTVCLGDDAGWIAVIDDEKHARIRLYLSRSLAAHVAVLVAKTRRLFDTDCEPARVSAALADFFARTEPRFCIEGIRVPCSFDAFEMSLRAIIGQQITVKAANTLAGRIAQDFGAPVDTPLESLCLALPGPATFSNDIAVARLGELGVIHQRAQAIRLLADGIASGSLALGLGCNAQRGLKDLQALPGIGPWTANYILMRAFHYSDGFPAADYGVKQAFPGLKPREIEALSQEWRPYRSYATMCTWCTH